MGIRWVEGIAQLAASSAAWSSRVWPAAHDGDRFAQPDRTPRALS